MLIGRYEHTLDAKSRVNFPPKLRAELGETFYITNGLTDVSSVMLKKNGTELPRF